MVSFVAFPDDRDVAVTDAIDPFVLSFLVRDSSRYFSLLLLSRACFIKYESSYLCSPAAMADTRASLANVSEEDHLTFHI